MIYNNASGFSTTKMLQIVEAFLSCFSGIVTSDDQVSHLHFLTESFRNGELYFTNNDENRCVNIYLDHELM
jgi:hypothetical protein